MLISSDDISDAKLSSDKLSETLLLDENAGENEGISSVGMSTVLLIGDNEAA